MAFPPPIAELDANEPRAWQLTARRLIRAANVLYREHAGASVRDPAYASLIPVRVLYGLAAENLIKGLLTAQGWPYHDDPRLKSHHLAWLFEQAKVPLGTKDCEVLDRLQSFLEKGRYPEQAKPGREVGDEVAHLLYLLLRVEDALANALPDEVLPRISLIELGLDGA